MKFFDFFISSGNILLVLTVLTESFNFFFILFILFLLQHYTHLIIIRADLQQYICLFGGKYL